MARKFFVGGNFKMNGTKASLDKIIDTLNAAQLNSNVEVAVAPPAPYLIHVREKLRPEIAVSSQNVFDRPDGAFTGEISVSQLKDTGATWTILGHSERRGMGETDAAVASKTKYALDNGVGVIWCCGESLEEREANKTIDIVTGQLQALKDAGISKWDKVTIAYEPIWAIGTGKVATPEQAQEVHAAIREWLKKEISQEVSDSMRILYGGSVNGKNSAELSTKPDIDGFLVGGASLKPEFVDIINSSQ
jgi:triosephosphate isomerase